MAGFNLNKGNQTAQNRLKLQKEREATETLAMPDARRVPLDLLLPNPHQVRKDFESPEAQAALHELMEDIRERDVLEPLIVRPIQHDGQEYYEIIAGERRFRAAQLLKKKTVPVIIKENWSESEARFASLAENLHRRDLTLLEECQFFLALENERNMTAKQIAKLISKSESYVNRRLQLAHNPKKLEELAQKGKTLSDALEGRTQTEESAETASAKVTERAGAAKSKERLAPRSGNADIRMIPFRRFRETLASYPSKLARQELDELELDLLEDELNQIEFEVARLKAQLLGIEVPK